MIFLGLTELGRLKRQRKVSRTNDELITIFPYEIVVKLGKPNIDKTLLKHESTKSVNIRSRSWSERTPLNRVWQEARK